MNSLNLNDYRCGCGKLLLKGVFFEAITEIKCRHCGKINKIGKIKIENDDTRYLFIVNEKGIFTSVSDSVCKSLGYSKEEIIGKHFSLINKGFQKFFGDNNFESILLLNEDSYLHLPMLHQHKNGELISVFVSIKLYKIDETKKGILFISKILKNETNIEKTKENNSGLIDKACDFYFEINKEAVGTYFCPAMEKIFNFKNEPFVDKKYFDILPPRQRIQSIKDFLFFSAKEQPYRIRGNKVDIKGYTVNYDAYFMPNFSDLDKFVGYKVYCWIDPIK